MARSRRPAPARAPARPAPKAAPPSRPVSTASTTPAPMQQPSSGGGMMSGIGSTIAQGMAFGTGSAIAHRAVGAVAESFNGGGGSTEQQQVQPVQSATYAAQDQAQGACANDKQMFYECLQVNKGDQQACSFLYEQLKQCQATSASMSFN